VVKRIGTQRRHDQRTRSTRRAQLERLEGRELLSYSPLNASFPDLVPTGATAPVAAYGQPFTIRADIANRGASSQVEPQGLAPGATSFADAGPTVLGVYISRSSHFNLRTAQRIGEVPVPAVAQNSVVTVQGTVTMPAARPGLPPVGGRLFVFFCADDTQNVQESDEFNNWTRQGAPIEIRPAGPNLRGIVLSVPEIVRPGDMIQPTVQVANFGTVDTAPQGPVTVQLVASSDRDFGPGDVILDTWTIANLPSLASVPLGVHESRVGALSGDINSIYDQANVVTLTGTPSILPVGPTDYFIGVIVDPLNTIAETDEMSSRLSPVKPVTRTLPGLPPAGVVGTPSNQPFPVPPLGRFQGVFVRPVDSVTAVAAASASELTYLATTKRISARLDLLTSESKTEMLTTLARRAAGQVGLPARPRTLKTPPVEALQP
jgi:hypothetical protein